MKSLSEHHSLKQIPVGRLFPHPDNPRKDLGDLSELTESIRQNGLLQNLTVTPAEYVDGVEIPDDGKQYYVVVIGHRRLAAAKLAGLETVPCADVDMDRRQQLATMIMENVQRTDLTPYEQAIGFEQMSMLGCTVEEISEKSGFSPTTVRRRLKMAELDHKLLQEVSNDEERQITLADFDELAEVQDVALRNEALKQIGTRDFRLAVQKAKTVEDVNANLPALNEWLKEHGCVNIERQEAWTSKYESFHAPGGKYYGYIYVNKLGETGNKLPTEEEIDGRKLLYTFDGQILSFYVVKPKAPKELKDPEQLAREKLARERKKEIKALSALHYGLRSEFIKNLKVTPKNREAVIMGGVIACLNYCHSYSTNHVNEVDELLGVDKYEHGADKITAGIGKLIDGLHDQELLQAVYAMFKDNEENWFASNMETAGCLPFYEKRYGNAELMLLYNWLMTLGYEMSTEEWDLMTGTHELYGKEKK